MKLKVRFDSPLWVECLTDKNWKILADFKATITGDISYQLVVPKDFETDFASVPRLPLIYELLGDSSQKPAVLHDYLYAMGGNDVNRQIADNIMLAAMLTNGNSWYQRWFIFAAIRVFGHLFFNYLPKFSEEK